MSEIGRREFLWRATAALGAAMSASVAAAVAAGAGAGAKTAGDGAAQSDEQRARLARLAELISPTTDTPGAVGAGVPAFVEEVVTAWYRPAERAAFLAGLTALAAEGRRRHGTAVAECTPAEQTALLAWSLEQAGDYRPPQFRTEPDTQAPFFWQLRGLTIVGYYTSQVGATAELRYVPIPGRYDGDYPFAEVGRAWSYQL
jgi:hypothetical protein